MPAMPTDWACYGTGANFGNPYVALRCDRFHAATPTCHPGQAMRQHRAEPGPIVPPAQWVPALAEFILVRRYAPTRGLGRDDRWGIHDNFLVYGENNST